MASASRSENAFDWVTLRLDWERTSPLISFFKASMARFFFSVFRTSARKSSDRIDMSGLSSPAAFMMSTISGHAGSDLLKQLQPFAADVPFERDEAGRVAARPRQAIDKAGADRIADTREHRRHGAAHLSQWP